MREKTKPAETQITFYSICAEVKEGVLHMARNMQESGRKKQADPFW